MNPGPTPASAQVSTSPSEPSAALSSSYAPVGIGAVGVVGGHVEVAHDDGDVLGAVRPRHVGHQLVDLCRPQRGRRAGSRARAPPSMPVPQYRWVLNTSMRPGSADAGIDFGEQHALVRPGVGVVAAVAAGPEHVAVGAGEARGRRRWSSRPPEALASGRDRPFGTDHRGGVGPSRPALEHPPALGRVEDLGQRHDVVGPGEGAPDGRRPLGHGRRCEAPDGGERRAVGDDPRPQQEGVPEQQSDGPLVLVGHDRRP